MCGRPLARPDAPDSPQQDTSTRGATSWLGSSCFSIHNRFLSTLVQPFVEAEGAAI